MEKINPDMIVLARESRGLTQSALASRLSISQAAISRIEAGLLNVSDEVLKNLSQILGYPEQFFSLDEKILGPGISGMGFIYHRMRKNIPIKTIAQIQAQINIRRIHISKLIRHVSINCPFEIPHFDIDEYNGKIHEIAQSVRAAWKLPLGPIKNLTESIESAGGIVIKCNFGTNRVDALSEYYPGSPPLFFINSKAPGDRLRFTLAHELGHIVMHREPNPHMEDEADLFASEFLMPSREIKPLLSRINLSTLANSKLYWKVSMAAILLKSRDLKVISPENYKYLWIEMGRSGYRRKEPIDIPLEEPTTLNKLLKGYREKLNYNISEISRIIALREEETRSLYFPDQTNPLLTIVK